MPMVRKGSQTEQNPIRFKNLLGVTGRALKARGLRENTIRRFLAPAADLLNHRSFWEHQKEGLAVFISPDAASLYSFSKEFPERVCATIRT